MWAQKSSCGLFDQRMWVAFLVSQLLKPEKRRNEAFLYKGIVSRTTSSSCSYLFSGSAVHGMSGKGARGSRVYGRTKNGRKQALVRRCLPFSYRCFSDELAN